MSMATAQNGITLPLFLAPSLFFVALPSGPTLLEWRLVLKVLWVLPE
jgi:hypothetical protein